MKKLYLLMVCMFACSFLLAQGVRFESLTLEQALEKARAEKKLVLVDMTATWCKPCWDMARRVLSLKEAGDYCNGRFVCIQLDVDQPEGKNFKEKYVVKCIPMFYLLESDGTVRHRLQGKRGQEDFMEWVRRGLKTETSMSYLEGMLKTGKPLNRQNQVDYYMVLKALNDVREVDSLREKLLRPFVLEKNSDTELWPVYKNEPYGSKFFNDVVKNVDIFRENVGRNEVDTYVWMGYEQEIQRLLYQNIKSREVQQLIDSIFCELSDFTCKGEDATGLKKGVFAWFTTVKSYMHDDVKGMIEGIKVLVEQGQWQDCLWYPFVFIHGSGDAEDREGVGTLTNKIVLDFAIDKVEQWDFLQKFRYLGFRVNCSKDFWENALSRVEQEGKPLLVECVKGQDAYFVNRNWAWDLPDRVVFLDSLCVSVRIDMDDPEVDFLREKFKITTYPAYFLLDKNGVIKYSWEGMIEEDQAFRNSVKEGLEKIKN